MKGKAFIVKTTGKIEYVEPEDGNYFSLKELKKAIGGGYIEIVPFRPNLVMVVDEDGKMKRLPLNTVATRIYNSKTNDYIVGDVLVCCRKQIR